MNKKFRVLIIFQFLLLTSASLNGDGYVHLNGNFFLQTKQRVEYEKKVLLGDKQLALDLYDHYGLCEQDIVNGNYWLMIGSENGNDNAMYNYSYFIQDSNPKRSFFYLFKSAENGFKYSLEKIQRQKLEYELPEDKNFETEITNDNIKSFIDGAHLGNQLAAIKLMDFYKDSKKIEIDKIDRITDKQNYIYWLHIGAANGSKECMKKYVEILSKSKDEYDNIRAEFWQKKSEEKE